MIIFCISQVSLHLNNEQQCFIHIDILFLGQQNVILNDLVWDRHPASLTEDAVQYNRRREILAEIIYTSGSVINYLCELSEAFYVHRSVFPSRRDEVMNLSLLALLLH